MCLFLGSKAAQARENEAVMRSSDRVALSLRQRGNKEPHFCCDVASHKTMPASFVMGC